MLMVDNTSIMAHHDAELEGGGDHLIDRLLEPPLAEDYNINLFTG
jgi:hypothetical protein